MRLAIALTLASLALVTAGCSDGITPLVDDAGSGPGEQDLAQSPAWPFPSVATSGGPVVAHPRIVGVVFAGDAHDGAIRDFHGAFLSSTYFPMVTGEYGVGALTGFETRTLTEAAPATIDDPGIQAWLTAHLGASAPLGAADPEALYLLYFPTGTTVRYGARTSCTDFNGYHRQVTAGGVTVGYAVIPRCAAGDGLTEHDRLTLTASHEIVEWATDPFPLTAPAWNRVNATAAAWELAFEYVLVDLCEGRSTRITPSDLGHVVGAVFSNRASLAGRWPCQPAPSPVYVAAIPTLPDRVILPPDETTHIELSASGGTVAGLRVAPGAPATVPIHVYAEAPTAASATVTAVELDGASKSAAPLGLRVDRAAVHAGDTLSLTVTAPSGFTGPAVVVLYLATTDHPAVFSRWPFVVVRAAP